MCVFVCVRACGCVCERGGVRVYLLLIYRFPPPTKCFEVTRLLLKCILFAETHYSANLSLFKDDHCDDDDAVAAAAAADEEEEEDNKVDDEKHYGCRVKHVPLNNATEHISHFVYVCMCVCA